MTGFSHGEGVTLAISHNTFGDFDKLEGDIFQSSRSWRLLFIFVFASLILHGFLFARYDFTQVRTMPVSAAFSLSQVVDDVDFYHVLQDAQVDRKLQDQKFIALSAPKPTYFEPEDLLTAQISMDVPSLDGDLFFPRDVRSQSVQPKQLVERPTRPQKNAFVASQESRNLHSAQRQSVRASSQPRTVAKRHAKVVPSARTAQRKQQDSVQSNALVQNPVVARRVPPSYPQRSLELGQQGMVVLHALVGDNGRPKEVRVAQSSGYRLLDHAARSAVRRWVFQPVRQNGRIVTAWVRVPVRFQLR